MYFKKEKFWARIFLILGSLIINAENQNQSIAFSAFETNSQKQKSFADQFEFQGHMQTKLQNYMPVMHKGVSVGLLLYANSP